MVTWFDPRRNQLPMALPDADWHRWLMPSHELPLDRAAEGYENFDARKDGWNKVILKPGH